MLSGAVNAGNTLVAAMLISIAASSAASRRQESDQQVAADGAAAAPAIGAYGALHRLGIAKQSVIEFNDRPVERIREGWETLDRTGRLRNSLTRRKRSVPHTLRHTAISWYLQPDRRTGKSLDIEVVSHICGVSVATIRKVYRHVMPEPSNPLLEASHHFGR